MKEGWKYTTIGESCNINYGTRVVRSKDGGTIYDVYGGGGATFKMDTYNREDCLVVARFAMSKQCTRYVKGKFFLNDSGLTVSPKDGSYLSQTLLDKILLALNDTIYSFGRGSAQRNLNIKEFSTMKIAYPINLAEQEKFVSLLDAEFAKIDAIKANAEKQLQDAKALFQSALKDYLTPKEGWIYNSFNEIYAIKMGKTPPRADKSMWDVNKETDNLWVSVADITSNEGRDIVSTKEHISECAAQKMHIVPQGSLLMSFKLTIGKMAFAGKNLYTNEAIIAIPDDGCYKLRFLYYYLSSYNWDTLTVGAEKVKGKTLNKSSISRIKLPIISLSDQQQIAEQLDKISAKIHALQSNFDTTVTLCNDLKQSILKDIFG